MMFSISTAICCYFLIIKSEGRRLTDSQTECAERRCCKKRREVTKLSTLHDILCETLSVEECGAHDETCMWDCYPDDHQDGERGFTDRHFVRVSGMKGKYVEPQPGLDNGAHHETFEECMSSGRLIERDDCGVEYEDTMDQKLLKQFCERNHEIAKATLQGDATDPVIDDVNDNSTDIPRRAVFGHDGRVEINGQDRDFYLWRKTLYYTYKKGDGSTARCTASMISQDWAITSAHCVWGDGDWYGDRKLWSHLHSCSDMNNDRLYTGIKVVTFTAYLDYATSGSQSYLDWDIAWIKLNKGTGLGWFGYGYNTGFSGNMIFDIISYPGDKPDCKKYHQSCVWDGWGVDCQTTSDCDTAGGASGAPIYRYTEGSGHVVYAVLSSESSFKNFATRITSSKFNAIRNYL